MKRPLIPQAPPGTAPVDESHGGLEIGGAGSGRRWMRLAAYVFLFALVGGVLAWVFVQFGATFALALLLVAFMIGYMVLIGSVTGKSLNDRQ